MPTGRLLQRWPGAVLSDSDRVWCMYAFVTLVYGLLLPLLLLYVKEVHFRGKDQGAPCIPRCQPALSRAWPSICIHKGQRSQLVGTALCM
jgi:hypothetical protein